MMLSLVQNVHDCFVKLVIADGDGRAALLQRCPRGYLNRALGWFLKKLCAEPPLRSCMAFSSVMPFGNVTSVCKWSGRTLRIRILMLCLEAALRTQASARFLYSNFANIL